MNKEMITAGELMDQQFLPRATLVEGLLTAGTYILAGTPKIGKSFFVTQLCWCISEGVPFLGLQIHRSAVLYLALEDTPERLQGRLAAMFGTDWGGANFHLKFREDTCGSELVESLHEFLFFNPNTRLIVIDTLQRIRENSSPSYSYAADYDEINPSRNLRTFIMWRCFWFTTLVKIQKVQTRLIRAPAPTVCWVQRMEDLFCTGRMDKSFWSKPVGIFPARDMFCGLTQQPVCGVWCAVKTRRFRRSLILCWTSWIGSLAHPGVDRQRNF